MVDEYFINYCQMLDYYYGVSYDDCIGMMDRLVGCYLNYEDLSLYQCKKDWYCYWFYDYCQYYGSPSQYCSYYLNYYHDKFDLETECLEYFRALEYCHNYMDYIYECLIPLLCGTKWS